MISFRKLLLKQQIRSSPAKFDKTDKIKGLTMIELLVGTIIAFLIITPLMGMVINLLNDDQKESAKATTDEDIQSALDYISEDLKQAIYIYDKKSLEEWKKNKPTELPFPTDAAQGTPILVFWKRELIPDSVPIKTGVVCDTTPSKDCDDQFVLSLVAYYTLQDTNTTWCPNGTPCPVRISRYEIDSFNNRDNTTNKVFPDNPDIKLNPTTIVKGTGNFPATQVLVNYLDYSANTDTKLRDEQCIQALGITNDTQWKKKGFTDAKSAETGMFRITDSSDRNSFYVCVDESRKLVQITMRGNALQRIQKNAEYKPASKVYFPSSSVTVQGGSNFLQ